MTTDSDTCKNCEYYYFDDDEGTCHRYPPIVLFDSNEAGAATEFPEVDEEDWCGEWKKARG